MRRDILPSALRKDNQQNQCTASNAGSVDHPDPAAFLSTGTAPSIRSLGKESGVPVKELYELFPKGPAKLAAKICGIPKPHGCI